MIHTIDGWQVEDFDGETGRIVDHATTKATGRGAVEDSGITLPGRRGKLPVPVHQPGPSAYTLSVTCVADDYVLARDMVAEVHRRLPAGRTVSLGRHAAGMDVFAPATVLASTDVDGLDLGNSTLQVKLVFQIPGGVWLDSVETTTTVPVGTNLIPALSGGSAPMEATFTVMGVGGSTLVEVTDVESGAWWRIAGNIPAGTQVTVDPLAHTAKVLGGADYSGLLTPGDRPFYIDPAARLTHVRNGSQALTVTARRSWYE